jgi:hypothetical protein
MVFLPVFVSSWQISDVTEIGWRNHPSSSYSSCGANRPLTNENAKVATPITAHVATVRHKASVPVNCQIARMEATTATTMQIVVVQKENLNTIRGFRNPFNGGCFGASGAAMLL